MTVNTDLKILKSFLAFWSNFFATFYMFKISVTFLFTLVFANFEIICAALVRHFSDKVKIVSQCTVQCLLYCNFLLL
jgi:hypothetical protein